MTAFQPEFVEQFTFDSSGNRVADLPVQERVEYWQRRGAVYPTPADDREEVTESCG